MEAALKLSKEINPAVYNFLTYYPLQVFQQKDIVNINVNDHKQFQLSKWLYDYINKTSLESYNPMLVKYRRTTSEDIWVSKNVSKSEITPGDMERILRHLRILGIDYIFVKGVSESRAFRLITTGYFKPLHKLSDYNDNFILSMTNLRTMEIQSTQNSSLRFIQQFSESRENLLQYLDNPVTALSMWSKLNNSHPIIQKSPVSIGSGLSLQTVVISDSKSIENGLKGYQLEDIRELVVMDEVKDLEYLRQLPNLTNLTFGKEFNQDINGMLPPSLAYLEFGENFNKYIEPNGIPNSITHLTFGRDFNQEIPVGMLPNSLTHLEFGDRFNKRIAPNAFPASLKYLKFGRDFRQEVPDSIKHLTFKSEFESKVESKLPPSIQNILNKSRNLDQSTRALMELSGLEI